MSQFRSKEFKKLQSEWYSKLKESGFEEAEDTSSPKEFMKEWHSSHFQSAVTPEAFDAKQWYYQRANSFLHTHNFSNRQERMIWTMHCEGRSLRQIAKVLDIKIWVAHRTVEYLSSLVGWSLVLLG